jgi:GMP synthase-like glutamine amidotransferase
VLEVSESPRKVLDEIDGLLLTGGGDIDPVLYGDERHPTVEDAEPGRDEFEIDLARRAMTAELPVLAICRGAQVLNVAAGGTLVQDIPSALQSALAHSITEPKSAEAHSVHVTPDPASSAPSASPRQRAPPASTAVTTNPSVASGRPRAVGTGSLTGSSAIEKAEGSSASRAMAPRTSGRASSRRFRRFVSAAGTPERADEPQD